MPDCLRKLLLMRSMISWFTFLGFLGTTEYCRLVRLKLCVNLKEREREWEGRMGEEGKRKGAEEGE